MSITRTGIAFCTTSLLALIGVEAHAAEADQRQPSSVEELVVTAERREVSTQDVPLAITAIRGSTLAAAGITSTDRLQFLTPGLVQRNAARSLVTYIRGVGTQSGSLGEEPNVSTYVDGIYIANAVASRFEFNNIARVEILKGPQGTLFGRNSTGGLIQIITRDPSSTPALELRAGYANYDTVSGAFYGSTGLTENLSADLSLVAQDQRDGWGTNVTTGQDINKWRSYGGRTKWVWTPTDELKVVAGGDYSKLRTDRGIWRQLYPGAIAPGGFVARGGPYDSQADLVAGLPYSEQYGANVTVQADVGAAKVTVISAYRRYRDGGWMDSDGSPLRTQHTFQDAKTRTIQNEAFIQSSVGGLDLTSGVIYLDILARNAPLTTVGTAAATNVARYVDIRTRSFAGYAQGTYAFGPQTNLTVGGRYTIDFRDLDGVFLPLPGNTVPVGTPLTLQCPVAGAPRNPITLLAPTTPQPFCSQSAHWDAFTWRVAIDHHFNDDTMGYASVSRGFKSGIFQSGQPASLPVFPEYLTAYAAGVKLAALDRRLRVNAEVFYYDYENIQLTAANAGNAPGSPPGSLLYNAASGRVKGVDMEISYAPELSFGDLQLSAGGQLINAKYRDFPSNICATPRLVAPFGNVQTTCIGDGFRMIRTPKFSGTLAATYSFPLAEGQVTLRSDLYHSSSFFWQSDNRLKQSAYSLLGARASYRPPSEHWTLSVWGANLADKRYQNEGIGSTFGDQFTSGSPRTYGVTVEYRM